MVFNLVESNIYIIDSLNQYAVDTNDPENEEYILCKRIMRAIEYRKATQNNWTINEYDVSPLQPRGSLHCGPYVCLQTYAMALKNEENALPYYCNQLYLFRKNMALTLFRNEVVEFDYK